MDLALYTPYPKILFLLKVNGGYGYASSKSGLTNSANFLSDFLSKRFFVNTKVAACIDGNSIDKEVHDYKPDVCFIEAIWVTPEKMQELAKLHPNVLFIIRIHSKTTFLANEGIAIGWIKEYNKIQNVAVSFNNERTNTEFNNIGIRAIYLPNVYQILPAKSGLFKRIFHVFKSRHVELDCNDTVHIGCFGAIRPMKNQLQQAVGAIRFGAKYGKKVCFHINAGRVEQRGENILKNIRSLFKDTEHELIEHGWLTHDDFLTLIASMDLGLQVSLTESFNIVSADFIAKGKPIIVSKEIEWVDDYSKVDTEDAEALADRIHSCLKQKEFYTQRNIKALNTYNDKAVKVWERIIYLLNKTNHN